MLEYITTAFRAYRQSKAGKTQETKNNPEVTALNAFKQYETLKEAKQLLAIKLIAQNKLEDALNAVEEILQALEHVRYAYALVPNDFYFSAYQADQRYFTTFSAEVRTMRKTTALQEPSSSSYAN